MTTASGITRDDTRAQWAAVGVALVMVAQLVGSRAVRDGFFLTHYAPTALATMMMVAALFSVATVVGSSRLLVHVPPARSLPFFFGVSAVLYLAEWLLALSFPRIAAATLYLHVLSLGALVSSGFWSVVNERFDPHQAKQLIGRIAGGASLGGVVGGVSAWWGASELDVATMILGLGVCNGLCALGVLQIGPGNQASAPADELGTGVVEIFRQTPYLRHLGLLVALTAFTAALYDYVFKSSAAEFYTSGADLVSFFALFYMTLNVVTFVIQNVLANASLRIFGLSFTVGLLPGSGVVLGVIGLLFPALPSAIAMRGGVGMVENSFFRSGYELLYTPILPEKKRPTKTLIDVGGDKLGTLLGAGFAFVMIALTPDFASSLMVLGGLAASLLGMLVTRQLHWGYVGSLEDSLRAGSLGLDDVPVVDATTVATLDATRVTLRRASLVDHAAHPTDVPDRPRVDRATLVGVARRGGHEPGDAGSVKPGATPAQPEPRPYRPTPSPSPEPGELDALTVAVAHLRSGDRVRIAEALRSHSPLPAALVGHVIPLLGSEESGDIAFEALRRVAPRCVGALIDGAASPRAPVERRRRLCDLLGRVPTQRCVDGLANLLADPDLELRLRVAMSLLALHRGNPELRIDASPVHAAVVAEAASCRRIWSSRVALDQRISATPPLDSADGRRVIQGVTLIFTLLLLVLEAEPLKLAIRALANPSGAHRGTGLEYLENVLPPPLLAELKPLLEDPRLATGTVRTRSAVLDEIVGARGDDTRDIETLRRHVDRLRGASA